VLQSSDIELLEIMADSLGKYLKAAGRLSDDAFNELSKHYGLLWMELTRQQEIIEELLESENLKSENLKQDGMPSHSKMAWKTRISASGKI